MTTLLDRLRAVADDPMWADHAEVNKSLLTQAIAEIEKLRVRKLDVERENERLHERLNNIAPDEEDISDWLPHQLREMAAEVPAMMIAAAAEIERLRSQIDTQARRRDGDA